MKKIIAMMIAVFMLLSFCLAGSAEGDKVKCYSFGVMSGGPAWGQYQKGFYAACEELGWEGQYLCPTTDNNMSELFNLHDTAISNGADVMIPCVTDNDAMADILQKAVDQGITMVGIGLTDPHIPYLIGTDNINLGRTIAEALVQCMGDQEIHVATMQTILAHTGQTSQVDAFEERLKELRPDAEVVRGVQFLRPDLPGQAGSHLPGESADQLLRILRLLCRPGRFHLCGIRGPGGQIHRHRH